MLPKRLKKARREGPLRSASHLKWVRGHGCSVPNCNGLFIEAAHVRTGTDGSLSVKPSDCWALSLCVHHHALQHTLGEASFSAMFRIDMKALAEEFWSKSPHGARKHAA